MTWGLGQVVIVGLAGSVALFLILRFITVLHDAAPAQLASACLALEGRPQDRQAPAFQLKDLEGRTVSLQQQRGKVVLLNLWATWCPPCVEELPSLIRLHRSPPPGRFALLMASVDDSADLVKAWLAKNLPGQGPLPIIMDPGKATSTEYGTSKFPETYLIDAEGKVRYRFINKREWSSELARECIKSVQ